RSTPPRRLRPSETRPANLPEACRRGKSAAHTANLSLRRTRQRRDVTAPEPCSSEDDQSARITSNAPTISELHRMLAFDAAPSTHGEMNTQTPMAAATHSSQLS